MVQETSPQRAETTPFIPRDKRGRFIHGNPYAQKAGEPAKNPKGRPKNPLCITALLRQLLQDNPDEAMAVAKSWLKGAKSGQIEHLKLTLRQFRELEPEGLDLTSKGEAIGTFRLRTADGDKTAKELKEADEQPSP